MNRIFVNLKRFDVPKSKGGICQQEDPAAWVQWIVDQSVENGLGELKGAEICYLLPESLIIPAAQRLNTYPESRRAGLSLGCQSVFRQDVKKGVNFGAFTANRPAAAMTTVGCAWAIIGHSEERRDKQTFLSGYDPDGGTKINRYVSAVVGQETACALEAGMGALVCVGETAEERGEGDFEQQKKRIEAVLKDQLTAGFQDAAALCTKDNLVIGYEPIWAIGPGKTPPGPDYIAFVSKLIKKLSSDILGFEPDVVYGGGLKEENAGAISGVSTIDGGLVALTRFAGEIGFYPDEFKRIVDLYLKAREA